MKTAISISDELFESAERFAGRMGMSRSDLYSTALRQYLREHRSEGVTERLNEVYGTELEGLEPGLQRLQKSSIPKDEW